MSSKTAFKTIEEYLFQENKRFIIPNYQRGYKWAAKEKGRHETAVEKLMNDLISADKSQQYFLQGVTVSEEGNNIILIDGQQRTTTLYLLFWCLSKDFIKNIKLEYDIRQQSKEFIFNLVNLDDSVMLEPLNTDSQDIYYFKKAIAQIKERIKYFNNTVKSEFIDFLRNKVTILYIVIDRDKATKTFTMMNGSKATMLQEELVKAEMLRKVSLPEIEEKQVSTSLEDNLNDLKEIITKDWETNTLRSRYAREWDKWLYWWNREDVKSFFNTENPMGLLLNYYVRQTNNKAEQNKNLSFEDFRCLLIENGHTEKQKTKLVFKELRDLQKSFEDIFNRPKVHNYLKMALICSVDKEDRFNIIDYFIDRKNDENLIDNYAKWRLVGATHRQIVKVAELTVNEVTKENKVEEALIQLSKNFVYQNAYDLAAKQLLRLNVEEDNKLKRKFDFSIWQNKSLEHIYPKSKVYHKNEQGLLFNGSDEAINFNESELMKDKSWLDRAAFHKNGSEHCIGNLVLLYGRNNSEFGAKTVQEKKETYFNVEEKFESRHLLHTISVFAQDKWSINEIQQNKEKILAQIKVDYNIKDITLEQYEG